MKIQGVILYNLRDSFYLFIIQDQGTLCKKMQ